MGFVGLTLLVLGFYWLVRAPVFNPSNYIDPWIYTGTFKNYDYLRGTFPWAYYPTRLPWIIPGIAVNSVLSPVPAFFVLHVTFFIAGGLFAFLLLRRYFGSTAAFLGYVALMLSPLFYDAYSNDYPDGAVLTYLLGGAYFTLGAWGSRRRTLRLAAGGFFLAGAVGTNLTAAFFVTGLILAYFAVFAGQRGFIGAFARDAAAFVGGALVLLIGCGIFSRTHRGEFLFFMPSVRAVSSLNSADYKAAGYGWMKGEPQLLLPLFALTALVVLVPLGMLRRWRTDATIRFIVGTGVYFAFVVTLISVWEFAYTGNLLETPYYFSLFNAPLALVVGAVMFFASHQLRRVVSPRGKSLLVAAAAIAIAAPTFLLFHQGYGYIGPRAAAVTLELMVISLVLLAATRFVRARRAVGLGVSCAAILVSLYTVGYAASGGVVTQSVFGTTPATYGERRATLSLATQLIQFVKDKGLQRTSPGSPDSNMVPGFWYDANADLSFTGMQSTYLWQPTWIGLDLPHVDEPMRTLLNTKKPAHLVLLCTTRPCAGAQKSLERAGYPNILIASRQLVSGEKHIWVDALELVDFRPGSPGLYYRGTESPFASTVAGAAVAKWNLEKGLPEGWGGAAAEAAAAHAGRPFLTSAKQWDYELVSPELTLGPGRYRVYASGRVLQGGLDLGVLDSGSSQWIEQRFYWSRQRGAGWMSTPFSLTQSTAIHVVLSNWVPSSRSSRWIVRRMTITRLP